MKEAEIAGKNQHVESLARGTWRGSLLSRVISALRHFWRGATLICISNHEMRSSSLLTIQLLARNIFLICCMLPKLASGENSALVMAAGQNNRLSPVLAALLKQLIANMSSSARHGEKIPTGMQRGRVPP